MKYHTQLPKCYFGFQDIFTALLSNDFPNFSPWQMRMLSRSPRCEGLTYDEEGLHANQPSSVGKENPFLPTCFAMRSLRQNSMTGLFGNV